MKKEALTAAALLCILNGYTHTPSKLAAQEKELQAVREQSERQALVQEHTKEKGQ